MPSPFGPPPGRAKGAREGGGGTVEQKGKEEGRGRERVILVQLHRGEEKE